MAKAGILLPLAEMQEEAQELLKSIPLDVACCRTIRTEDTLNEARRAVQEGAEFIVARGYQAKIIKKCMKIPLVEIRFTGQEVCLFVQRAKEIAGRPHPHIAVIAFENMLPDMTYIAQLMDVELTVSFIEKMELAEEILESYESNRPDVIVGGEITCAAAKTHGYLTVYYRSTPESLAAALRTAQGISYAIDAEQQHITRFETALDSSFNAILQVNTEHTVLSLNHTAEELMQCREEDAIGRPVEEILSGIDLQPLDRVLSGERESITTSVEYNKEAFMVFITSLKYDTRVTGAILSFRQLSAVSGLSRQARRELLLSGFRTDVTFRDLPSRDPRMQEILQTAELFALSESPVLLYEREGKEAAMIARAIHNNSNRKAGPFVSLDVRDLFPEEQVAALLYRGGMQPDDPRLSTEHRDNESRDHRHSRSGSQTAALNQKYSARSGSRPGTGHSAFVYDRYNKEESGGRFSFGEEGSGVLGALIRAHNGTLFLNRIEQLTLQAQHQLLRILLPWTHMHTDARPVDTVNVRIIACAKHNLLPAVEAETFSEELFYHFSGLSLTIPPLEQRPEDLKTVFCARVEKYASCYHRHLRLTEEGLRLAAQLAWPGGFGQVDAFCERLVLSSKKRRLDEQVIRDLFNTLYPEVRRIRGEERLVIYDAPEAKQIRDLMEKHGGDRDAVARELGISKTTLWRHMKKYNVTPRYKGS